MDPNGQKLEEILKLTRENNKILRTIRRHAFWGGIIKFAIYAALMLVPIWIYMTYLNASVQRMIQTVDQIQGAGAKAQDQFGSLQQSWKEMEARLPAFMRPQATSAPVQR